MAPKKKTDEQKRKDHQKSTRERQKKWRDNLVLDLAKLEYLMELKQKDAQKQKQLREEMQKKPSKDPDLQRMLRENESKEGKAAKEWEAEKGTGDQ